MDDQVELNDIKITEMKLEQFDSDYEMVSDIEIMDIKRKENSEGQFYKNEADTEDGKELDIANIPVSEDFSKELVISGSDTKYGTFEDDELHDKERTNMVKDLLTTTSGYEHLTVKKVKCQRITKEQKSYMLQFMEEHPHLVNKKFTPSFTFDDKVKLWKQLAKDLEKFGPAKNVANWKKCWKDIKGHVKKMASQVYKEKGCTGGGATKVPDLSPMKERIMGLIGGKFSAIGNNDIPELLLTTSELHSNDLLFEKALTDDLSFDYCVKKDQPMKEFQKYPKSVIMDHDSIINNQGNKEEELGNTLQKFEIVDQRISDAYATVSMNQSTNEIENEILRMPVNRKRFGYTLSVNQNVCSKRQRSDVNGLSPMNIETAHETISVHQSNNDEEKTKNVTNNIKKRTRTNDKYLELLTEQVHIQRSQLIVEQKKMEIQNNLIQAAERMAATTERATLAIENFVKLLPSFLVREDYINS